MAAFDKLTEAQVEDIRRAMPARVYAVMRPVDAATALRLTKEWHDRVRRGKLSVEDAQAAFNAILASQNYTYVGTTSPDGEPVLVDPETGLVCGKLEPGDSFIAYEDLQKLKPVPPTTTEE